MTKFWRAPLAAMLAMLAAAPAGTAPPPAPLATEIQVDPARTIAALPPIWRFFGADEPNYATRPDGDHLLAELGALRPGQIYFRAHNLLTSGDGTPDFKWGSTNALTMRGGKPVYDWHIVDGILDRYRARGIHPYLEIGFMPAALTSAPAGVPYRRPWHPGNSYAGITAGWSYPPTKYEQWAELIYQWTRHNVARYGRAEVERWYFEVWNEPNLDFYWSGDVEQFLRLHDTAIAAVRRALPTARVGGPDVAGAGGAFMDRFLHHVTQDTNYANGARGTPTDFLSFHAKGQPVLVDGHVRMGIADQLRTADQGFAKIAAIPALAAKPIVIGENDPEGCAACPGPANAYRNGPLYASYTAASYARLWELARRRGVTLDGALSWSFTFVGQPWFAGYRQLASNGVDLAVLNVFRLFARLGPRQIAASSDRAVPLDTLLQAGVRAAPDVGVLATRTATGGSAILLWHYHDDDVPGPEAAIRLRVAGRHGLARARLWRVDATHANSFGAWQAMGSPARPDRAQIERLKAASRLRPEALPMVDGTATLRLPRQGVALIEIGA
ncbi:GH39 family glycosyl hydrolase [Sphingomonas morindae]|uniref:Beta-xylosidase n=1 Tax=Sphingomonas morindae TaxID=1541170 RepID=A0ABY4X795_9SPHN|nr:beta-xylosidase [Sphingomonas morindae]USI72772.1 beta-xylosidase [Sphingomonas morindae]